MTKKKKLILELIILITIIISIVVIIFVYQELNSVTPKESTSNEITNYSENKYVKIEKKLDDITKFSLPAKEWIANDISSYTYYITSTDNIINTISEIIIVVYNSNLETGEALNKDQVTNFCNSYNDVNTDYQLKCTYSGNTLTIYNIIFRYKIFTDSIKTKKYTIDLPMKKDSKLDEYLESLDNNNIKYTITKSIDIPTQTP